MQTDLQNQVAFINVLEFLDRIRPEVNDINELLLAIRTENDRIELYGQQHLNELLEISAYQWQLEQLEMKLKAPSLITISFLPEGGPMHQPESEEAKIETKLLQMIMGFIRDKKTGSFENGILLKKKTI
jgi:hypothetical protein